MDNDMFILIFVLVIAFIILFRIIALKVWLKYSVELKKDSKGKYSTAKPGFGEELERDMRLKKHRIALRRANVKRSDFKK